MNTDEVWTRYDCGREIRETYKNHYDIYLRRCPTCEAAPELLEMCESLYCIVLDGMIDYDYTTEQLGKARILIAKARGGNGKETN